MHKKSEGENVAPLKTKAKLPLTGTVLDFSLYVQTLTNLEYRHIV